MATASTGTMYVGVKLAQPRRERNLLLDPSIVIKVIDIAHTLYFFLSCHNGGSRKHFYSGRTHKRDVEGNVRTDWNSYLSMVLRLFQEIEE